MARTLTRVLHACTLFKLEHPYCYSFGLVHEDSTATVECYSRENSDRIIMGSVVVHGKTIIVNDGHDSSLRDGLEKYGIRSR